MAKQRAIYLDIQFHYRATEILSQLVQSRTMGILLAMLEFIRKIMDYGSNLDLILMEMAWSVLGLPFQYQRLVKY